MKKLNENLRIEQQTDPQYFIKIEDIKKAKRSFETKNVTNLNQLEQRKYI